MALIPAWAMWSVFAGVNAVAVEWINRVHPGDTFLSTLPKSIIFIVLLQLGLFKAWSASPQLLLAWVAFFASTQTFRLLLVTVVLGETYPPIAWLGFAFCIVGTVLMHLAK